MNDRKPAPTAVCRNDGAPLILSFEQRGKEFLCMECGQWYEYLAPAPEEPTEALANRLKFFTTLYDKGVRKICQPCGGIGSYTTEGSPAACEQVGLVVLEDNQDGTCCVQCAHCGGHGGELRPAIFDDSR